MSYEAILNVFYCPMNFLTYFNVICSWMCYKVSCQRWFSATFIFNALESVMKLSP